MVGALLLGFICGVIARVLMPGDVFRTMSGPTSWAVSLGLGLVQVAGRSGWSGQPGWRSSRRLALAAAVAKASSGAGGLEPGEPTEGIDVAQDVLAARALDELSTAEFGEDAADIGAGAAAEVGEVGLGEAPVEDGAVGRRGIPGLGCQSKQSFGHATSEIEKEHVIDEATLGDDETGQGREQGQRHRWVVGEEPKELLAVNRPRGGVGHADGRAGPRHAAQDGELAEQVA
jgi:hypothetical protein